MFTFEIIRGSSRPVLELTLKNSDGTAVDLTTAQSVYLAAAKSVETAQADLAIYKQMTVTSAASGVVKAVWTSTDTDVPAALYHAEVRVTFGASDVAKFGPCQLNIQPATMA